MKNNKIFRMAAPICAVAAFFCITINLVQMATYTPTRYPFVYYSSGLSELVELDFSDKDYPMTSTKTAERYTTAQCDSLMPIFNYRQLFSDGVAPDTILGVAVDMRTLNSARVVFRQSPSSLRGAPVKLYTLFESMPKRVGLTVPDDFFRLSDKVEFIDAATNTVSEQKSEEYTSALLSKGYTFPSQWAIGNPSARKSYDEGYFSLDAAGELFHIKMVNGVPFIKNTLVSDSIDIEHFAIYEVASRRFYGFVFSKEGDVYILESGEGRYTPRKLDIPAFDVTSEEMMIMGDMFFWTVAITDEYGKRYYALRSDDLTQIDSHEVVSDISLGSSTHKLLNNINKQLKKQ